MSKKNKSGKRRDRRNLPTDVSLAMADDDPTAMYGEVEKPTGSCMFSVVCADSVTRVCTLRGSLRNKIRISSRDIVLITLDESSKKGYIIHRYTAEEVRILRSGKKIPESFIEELDVNVDFDLENI